MQDLHVADVLPQMITLSESYIQIYEVRKAEKEDAMTTNTDSNEDNAKV